MDSDRGRDDRFRKDSGSDTSGRRDRRPDSRRDSRPTREPENKPKDREPLPKAADSDKGVKHGKEQEKEHTNDAVKEKEKKEKESGVARDSTPPGEEARGTSNEEKSRSEEEANKRRLRNKVNRKMINVLME